MDVLEFMKRRADLQSLILGAGTVLAGTAAAVIRGNMEIFPAIICLLFALFAQLGCNLYHYYVALERTPESSVIGKAPARVASNMTALRLLREGSKSCLIISLMLGISVLGIAKTFWLPAASGLIIYLLAYFMARNPGIYRSPFSLVITFLVFGPLGVMTTAFLQYQSESIGTTMSFFDSAPSIFLGPAMGFLACSHHITMSYFNRSIDPNKNRPSLAKCLGQWGTVSLIFLNGLLALALMIVMVFLLGFPDPIIALVPGFIACCINSYIACRIRHAGVGELAYLNTLSRVNFLMTGLVSFIIWWIIGAPDDSLRVLFPS